MQRRLIQGALILSGALAIVGASASESQAFFWWHSRCCYRPVYRPIYYRPVYTSYYAPACNPCGSYGCSPCGYGCNPCGGCSPCGVGGCGIACGPGGCSIDSGASSGSSGGDELRDPEPPQTFRRDEESPPDDGFRPRGNDDLPPSDDIYNQDALKVDPGTPESTIRQKQPAPMPEPEAADEAQEGGTQESEGSDVEAESPQELQLPPFQFDDKITWKPRTSRSRLQIRASFANPIVERTKVDPNSNWEPVPSSGLKLVSK